MSPQLSETERKEESMGIEGIARKCMSPNEAAKVAGIGRTLLYREIRDGRLIARKIGRRTVITTNDLTRWFNSLPKRHP